MLRSDMISDELWAVIAPVLPDGSGRRGRPWNDHRLTLEGIAWRFRTGSPWRDLPDHFGAWQSIWERHRRWSTDGTYQKMFDAVRADAPDGDDETLNLISVDSTSVRAHQHAAGARFSEDTGGRIELQESARGASRSCAGTLTRRLDHEDSCPDRRVDLSGHRAAVGGSGR